MPKNSVDTYTTAAAQLFKHITQLTGHNLTVTEKQIIIQNCRTKQLKRRQVELNEGDRVKYMTFIVTGSMRMFATDGKGREHTLNLALEGNWICDYEGFFHETRTRFFMEAAEDSVVIKFTAGQLTAIQSQVPAFTQMMLINNHQHLVASQKRMEAAISMQAEERYRQLLSDTPDLVNRFTQNVLASFLGMTCETFSRIRKQALFNR